MAQLKIDIILDDNGAVDKAKSLEAAVRGIEGAANATGAAQQNLAKTTSSSFASMSSAAAGWVKMASAVYGGMLIDRGIDSLQRWTGEALKSSSALVDMSAKSGLSTRTLQQMNFVAAQSGVSMNAFANAATMLGVNAGKGTDAFRVAIKGLGLDFEKVRQMGPDQLFHTVVQAAEKIEDPVKRNTLLLQAFGGRAREALPAIASGYSEIARQANITADSQIRMLDDLGDKWDAFIENRKAGFRSMMGSFVEAGQNRGALGVMQTLGAWLHGMDAKDVARVSGSGGSRDINLPVDTGGQKTFTEMMDDERDSERRAKDAARDSVRRMKEATDAAEKWKDEQDELFGTKAIEKADEMLTRLRAEGVLKENGELTTMWAKAQERVNETLGEAIGLLHDMGLAAPMDMFDTWLQTALPKVQNGIKRIGEPMPGQSVGSMNMADVMLAGYRNTVPVGSSIAGIGQQLALPTAPTTPGLLESAFGSMKDFGSQLSGIIMSSLTGGGDMGKSVGGFLGGGLMGQLGSKLASTMGGTLGGIVGNIFGPLGSMLGSMLGNLVGKIGGAMAKLFGRGDDGDKERDQFQNAMGGSANLYQDLIDAFGQEGRKMFDDLQSANSGKEVTEAADKIQQALEAHAEAIERAMQDIPAAVLSRSQNITSQHDFSTVGGQAMGALQFMIGEGMGPIEALNALTPAINAMRDALAAGNIETTAASDRLFYLQDILTQNSVAFQNIAASGSIVSAMFAANHRDAQLFAVSANDIGHNLQSIIDKGVPMSEVFAMSQSQLQSVWMAQKEWGFAVDETTQSLLNQAEQQGFVGEHLKDINQQILDVMLAIAQVLGADIPAYLQQLPGHAQNAATGMQNAFDGIKGPALPGGWTAPSPGDVESMIANLPTSPAYGPNSRTTSGSSQPMVINNVLDGRVLTSVVMEYQAEAVHELGLI